MNLASSLTVFASVVLTLSCCAACTSNTDVVEEVESPDHNLVAILEESSGDATTSYLYRVLIKDRRNPDPKETLVASVYGATRSQSSYGLDLTWLSSKALLIQYWKAQRVQLFVKQTKIGGIDVEVSLKSGVLNTQAPSGSMEYARLHKQR